jgi:outer membrane lipoprotein-sorting protein
MAALHQRTGGTAILAAMIACLAACPALAQGTPLPLTGSTTAPGARAAAQAPRVAQNQPPSPASNPFAALLGKSNSASGALSAEQRTIIGKINSYLSSVQQMSGKFVQVGPDGSRSQGDFYISKPGRVRFEYDDPSPIELIADGQSVVVRDRKLATQDVYPLSQTPLRFLLSDKVDLMKDSSLTSVYADDVFVTAVLEEKNGLVGTSRLMIMFNAKDMQLKQWTVTDPQGYDTTVAVYNLDSTKTPDPSMFRIDYTRYK